VSNPLGWVPEILSEYDVGRAIAAIEAVNVLERPIAEVGCCRASLETLEADLRGCLDLARADEVRFWTRSNGDRWRFGFYREPWALEALDFLDRAELGDIERAWIGGLLFGHRASAIQQFIERSVLVPAESY
jgi:hypothetical protein